MALEEGGRIKRSRGAPVFPNTREVAALYLAIAYVELPTSISAPDKVLHRLLELGWLKSLRPRIGLSCGIAWLDWERIERHVDHDRAADFVREVLALQMAKA